MVQNLNYIFCCLKQLTSADQTKQLKQQNLQLLSLCGLCVHVCVCVCGCVTGHHKGDRFSRLNNEGWRGDSDIW